MADQLIKISDLSTVTGAAATNSDKTVILNSGATKAMTLNELKNYLTNQGLGASVTNNSYTTVLSGGSSGNFYEKRYYRTNAVPSTPSDTPYPPSLWSTSPSGGNQVLWSTTGLILSDSSGLVSGTHWSTPVRESGGSVAFFVNDQPSAGYVLEGDVWYDTNDNNKLYRYNGSNWVAAFTPFPGIDTSGNITGLVKATGTNATFAIIASAFQIIDPWANSGSGAAAVPFEIVQVSGVDQVFINSAHIRNLDAGVITGGEITAAISLQSPTIKAGKLNTSSALYNPDNESNTMPLVCYGNYESSGSPLYLIDSTTQSGASPDWVSNNCTFYGWNVGSGYNQRRFGKSSMLFNYNLEAYANTQGVTDGANLNVVYQVNSGPVTQVQFPQADCFGARLFQHGGIMITGLTSSDTVKFGYRAAAGTVSGTGGIQYVQLTITGFNL